MARHKPVPDIARRLREARAKVFPTAQAAADALGVNATTLRTHEAGTRGIGLDDLQRYARRYGVAFDWLATGKGDETPNIGTHFPLGAEWVAIEGVIQDGAWIPGDLDQDVFPGWGPRVTPAGIPEAAIYDDPRFPPDMVSGFKVRTERTDGPYIDGSIVFVVDHSAFGIREGDHVFILRHRRGFVEWTLREARPQGYARLLSTGPDEFEDEDEIWIVGVVIGSITRRPVPPLSSEARKLHEVTAAIWRKNADAT